MFFIAYLNYLRQSQYDKQIYTVMSIGCTSWIVIPLDQQQFLRSKENTFIKMFCVTKLKHEYEPILRLWKLRFNCLFFKKIIC